MIDFIMCEARTVDKGGDVTSSMHSTESKKLTNCWA